MKEWTTTHMGNKIVHGEGFMVSYNDFLNISGNTLGSAMGSDNRSAETALCFDNTYLILNGDFRKEYEAVIDEGLDACKKVYEAHSETNNSSWSN